MLLDQFATFLRYLGLATCDIDVSSPVFTTEKMIHHKFCGTTGTSKTFLQHRQPRHSGQWNMTSNITGTWMTGLGMVEAPDMTESSLRHAPDHVQDIAWTWPGHSWVLAWAALGPWSGKSLNWILLIPGSSVSINLTLLGVLLTHFFVLPSNSSCHHAHWNSLTCQFVFSMVIEAKRSSEFSHPSIFWTWHWIVAGT